MRLNRFVLSCLFSAVILSMSYAKNAPFSSVEYYKGSMEEAKKKAIEEGKLFFVDFYANWCAPCKWMDETAFADKNVVTMLNQNYVSLKVDIDEFDGFSLKQHYKIKYLPTILIFNEKGELVDRIEETLSPRKLLEILENHHNANTSIAKVKPANSSPSDNTHEKEFVMPADDFELPEKDNYRVQVGIYSDFKNTFRYVNELKEQFEEPIIVLNDYSDGKIVYRVLMGEFHSKNEATSFVEILKREFGISAIVK